ncbi:hypothetical protein AB0D14_22970 [Streptomyces sp. NPDC048484]|uniref:hypothetical protein n=1 Tax=Streptomyces sp. NPDC048484 TaxID=3155146 RepID=UPI00342DBA99
MAKIKNVVILGDSMSDIGNKWIWPSGQVGRLFGRMRVNETGRFSDGKNWTDFLVEWSTGEALMWGNSDLTIRKSTDYRTLSNYSVLDVDPGDKPPQMKSWRSLDDCLKQLNQEKTQSTKPVNLPERIKYVNYAMGGCIATRDWTIAPKFGALSYLRGQVEDYIGQRKALDTQFAGPTLHVVWIGLNDFVTAERPDYDPAKVPNAPATNDYAAWRAWSQAHPGELRNGEGAYPAVEETRSLIELIVSSFPGTKADQYFMVIDLPSVYNAIRYMDGIAEPDKVEQAKTIDPVISRYNGILKSLVLNWPDPTAAAAPAQGHVHLVEMSKWMNHISQNLDVWHLSKKAQDPGVKPFYDAGIPPAPQQDPVAEDVRRRITTSDLGHPTQAVYSLIARYFVTKLLKSGHTLGRLDNDTWSKGAPFSDQPFDIPS